MHRKRVQTLHPQLSTAMSGHFTATLLVRKREVREAGSCVVLETNVIESGKGQKFVAGDVWIAGLDLSLVLAQT